MPLPLQIISNIIPAKWFIIIIKAIMLKGVGLQFVWKETLILIGMAVFFIGLSVKKYKINIASVSNDYLSYKYNNANSLCYVLYILSLFYNSKFPFLFSSEANQ